LPEHLHSKAAALAEEQGVSLNQFFLYSISSMVANLEAQKFFTARKNTMSKDEAQAKALSVLDKVKERPVMAPNDEIIQDR